MNNEPGFAAAAKPVIKRHLAQLGSTAGVLAVP
jgi:hypothetical protein